MHGITAAAALGGLSAGQHASLQELAIASRPERKTTLMAVAACLTRPLRGSERAAMNSHGRTAGRPGLGKE